MAPKRSLPAVGNPLLQPDKTPQHELLVERRKLGQTELSVKPGQKNTSNATKDENLGPFDYAHLRAPLPKDLRGSGIFPSSRNQPVPESYYLMRRSSDGFVSATGMFKASFPWASQAEEEKERDFIKSLDTTDIQEVAGNIWVPPEHAVELAIEYSILPWIEALLDNEEIDPDSKKAILSPPKFKMPSKPPHKAGGVGSTRKRKESKDTKSASPSKKEPSALSTPGRPKASPRKRAKKDADVASPKAAKAATSALQSAISDVSIPDGAPSDKVRVSVHSAVERNGDVETTHTAVKVDLPKDAPDLPLPADAEGLVELGKEIVKEASKLETKQTQLNGTSSLKRSKRKADKLLEDGEGASTDGTTVESPAAKRVRTQVLQDEIKREKVKSRALIGLTATLALGAIIPYVSNMF